MQRVRWRLDLDGGGVGLHEPPLLDEGAAEGAEGAGGSGHGRKDSVKSTQYCAFFALLVKILGEPAAQRALRAFSTAATSFGSSGETALGKASTGSPLRSTTYLWKFHFGTWPVLPARAL